MACWGLEAPSVTQAITTAVNHLFNTAFTLLSTFPAGPISDLVGGALVLIRRTLFLVPEGVTASQVGNALTVAVNAGSVAYLRQNGSTLQISGDPWFAGAATFTTTPDVTVSAINPGNAGCAGLVLTSGELMGSLQASQIDSIRFGASASVDGAVSASVDNGNTLTLRDAVRSKHKIVIDAPVILANNVSIDAGDGDVTFAGTVDAARAGRQALTVTALGKTTFEAAVGGRAALAGVTTQGISPLVVTQSADTATVPLHFLPEFSTSGQSQVKYGIDVAVGDNPSQIYEFDTGGVAFFAGYNSSLWKSVPLTSTPVSETYSSGNYFDGVVANTPITIGTGTHTVSTAQPIQIAAILNGGNANKDTTFDFTDPDAPPVEDHFFGDFGASFDTLAVPGLDSSLANPLFQLPGNLSSGFLVQLGPIGIQPQLTVGITDALRAQFTYAVPVTPQPGDETYPVSGYPVLSWFGFSPSYHAQQGDQQPQQIGVEPTLPSLIDSGAPSTGIRTQGQGGDPYNVGGQLQPGTKLIAQFPTTMGRPPLTWTLVAGDNGSVDLVNYQQGEPGGIQNVNTGLNLYNEFDVMFDVANQVIWLRPTGGQSTVTLQSVTTTGSQIYRQNANLSGTYSTGTGDLSIAGVTTLLGTTLVDAGGDVMFSGTVDASTGAESLTVNSTAATTFVREVGSLKPLAALTTDAGGSTSTASVTTTGSQTYNDAVSLNGEYSLSSGSFSVGGAATLAGPTSVASGDITFGGRIDSASGRGYQLTLTLGDGKTATLDGDVGAVNPLGGLAVFTNGSAATVAAPGYVALAGNLGFSSDKGLYIGDGVTATFTGGGLIQGFTNSGVVIEQSTGSVINDFAISGNGGNGVQINGASNTVVEGNVILNNGSDGVVISAGSGNQVLSNSIFGNGGTGGLGIHLEGGANNDQPPPDLDSATLDSADLTVTFTVEPPNSGAYTVQVFYSPAGATPEIQGQQLLQTLTGIDGPTTVTISAPVNVVAGGYITLTATSTSGDTSEFSGAAQIASP